jgi:hypothetical protein
MPTIAYVHRCIAIGSFTIFVETTVLFFMLTYVYKERFLRVSQILFAGVFASFSTIPYVWFIFPRITVWPYNTALMFSETFVWLVEAFLYNRILRLSPLQALVVSAVCNFASWYLTFLLRSQGITFAW